MEFGEIVVWLLVGAAIGVIASVGMARICLDGFISWTEWKSRVEGAKAVTSRIRGCMPKHQDEQGREAYRIPPEILDRIEKQIIIDR